MNTEVAGRSGPTDRYDRAATILRAYPEIDPAELLELTEWFRNASAMDVANLASNDSIAANYELFRKQHIDRFSVRDFVMATIGILILLGFVALIGVLAG